MAHSGRRAKKNQSRRAKGRQLDRMRRCSRQAAWPEAERSALRVRQGRSAVDLTRMSRRSRLRRQDAICSQPMPAALAVLPLNRRKSAQRFPLGIMRDVGAAAGGLECAPKIGVADDAGHCAQQENEKRDGKNRIAAQKTISCVKLRHTCFPRKHSHPHSLRSFERFRKPLRKMLPSR